MEKTLKVKSTRDYGMFKYINGNRDIKEKHVKKLAMSMSKNNLLPYQPVLVNDKMMVIDGQHRIEAAKLLGTEVYYIEVPGIHLEEVYLLNENVKNWSVTDFAVSYAKLGINDYKILLDFYREYGLPITSCASLLAGRNIQSGGSRIQESIKSGRFRVNNEKDARTIAGNLKEIGSIFQDIYNYKRIKGKISIKDYIRIKSGGKEPKQPAEPGGSGSSQESQLTPSQLRILHRAREQVTQRPSPKAPICEDCSLQMVERTRRDDGGKFYGCVNYPHCSNTEEHEDDVDDWGEPYPYDET